MAGIATAREISGKTAAETVNRTMDFSEKLDTDETLTGTPTVSITPGGVGTLTCGASNATGKVVTLRLAAGTAGTTYSIKVTIGSTLSQVLEGLGVMEVREA